MKHLYLLLLLTLSIGVWGEPKEIPMNFQQVTPLLTVDKVEPCLEFWKQNFDFEVLVTVPHGDELGFVILGKGPVQLMYQSRASLLADIPQVAESLGRSMLYFNLESLDPIRDGAGNSREVVPERTTFYGRTEIVVEDPAGHVMVFSAEAPQKQQP